MLKLALLAGLTALFFCSSFALGCAQFFSSGDYPIEQFYRHVKISIDAQGKVIIPKASKAFILWRSRTPSAIPDERFAAHYATIDHVYTMIRNQPGQHIQSREFVAMTRASRTTTMRVISSQDTNPPGVESGMIQLWHDLEAKLALSPKDAMDAASADSLYRWGEPIEDDLVDYYINRRDETEIQKFLITLSTDGSYGLVAWDQEGSSHEYVADYIRKKFPGTKVLDAGRLLLRGRSTETGYELTHIKYGYWKTFAKLDQQLSVMQSLRIMAQLIRDRIELKGDLVFSAIGESDDDDAVSMSDLLADPAMKVKRLGMSMTETWQLLHDTTAAKSPEQLQSEAMRLAVSKGYYSAEDPELVESNPLEFYQSNHSNLYKYVLYEVGGKLDLIVWEQDGGNGRSHGYVTDELRRYLPNAKIIAGGLLLFTLQYAGGDPILSEVSASYSAWMARDVSKNDDQARILVATVIREKAKISSQTRFKDWDKPLDDAGWAIDELR